MVANVLNSNMMRLRSLLGSIPLQTQIISTKTSVGMTQLLELKRKIKRSKNNKSSLRRKEGKKNGKRNKPREKKEKLTNSVDMKRKK